MKLETVASVVAVFAALGVAGAVCAPTRWSSYTNREYGVTMLIPDVEHCVAREEGDVGHMVCRYPEGLQVDVFGSSTALSLSELRDEAERRVSGAPPNGWQWRTINDAENGYRFAESWTADSGGRSVIGLVGQSSGRTVSHIVFLSGSDAALARHRDQVALFIDSINAI